MRVEQVCALHRKCTCLDICGLGLAGSAIVAGSMLIRRPITLKCGSTFLVDEPAAVLKLDKLTRLETSGLKRWGKTENRGCTCSSGCRYMCAACCRSTCSIILFGARILSEGKLSTKCNEVYVRGSQ